MKVGAALVERQATDSENGTGLDSAWSVIRTGLRRDVGARLFDQWLKPARLGDYCPESQTLDLLVATDFSANFVSGQFGDRLRMAWRSAGVGVREVRVRRAPDACGPRLLEVAPSIQTEPVMEEAIVASNFQPRHRLDDFVVGRVARLGFVELVSRRCSFMAARDRAKPICCTVSPRLSPRIRRRPRFSICRPNAS